MTQYIQKLPAVFQTTTEKKFFDATFDQVLAKKDSDYLAAFIGRRNPGEYNPITDFYIPEASKNRTWWQLEATAYARNEDATKSNIFFYDDLLERIEYYGGNTLNQDRLFESEYYSFGPPIDYDMFVNYTNYYWIEQGLNAINITGVLASDILGKTSYTTPPTAIPPNLTLTTGMSIVLIDDPEYAIAHTVENFGNCNGIGLIQKLSGINLSTVYELLPWDGSIELSNGRVISNTNWDEKTWETQTQPVTGDYITIERGSRDRNAWSRSNKWYHIDTINQVCKLTNVAFPSNATRALRPIIQFIADLELFKSGTQYRDSINFGFKNNENNQPLLLSDLQGQQLSTIESTLGININNGDLVAFFNDYTVTGNGKRVNQFIYKVNIQLSGAVNFDYYTSDETPVLNGDIVFIKENAPYNGAKDGQTWYFQNDIWQEVYREKISTNYPPLFQLYDHDGISLDDSAKYPNSDFLGSEIFSYKVNKAVGSTVDPVLKFPIVYKDLRGVSDIVFQNDLIVERYIYSDARVPIPGYYYYKSLNDPILYNNWNLYQPSTCSPEDITSDTPELIEVSKQRVIDRFVVGYGAEYKFKLSVTPYYYPENPDIIVSVNGNEVNSIEKQDDGYTFEVINDRIYVNLTTYLTKLLLTTQTQPPVVEVLSYTHDLLNPDYPGYFEIPQQLEANPTQEEVSELSLAELTPHFVSIIHNQLDFTGVAYGGNNNYRDSTKNRSVGSYILQNIAPALKSMLVSSSTDLDFINSIRFSQDEYTKFKNKFLSTALRLINEEFSPVNYHNNSIILSLWVDEILKTVNVSKEFSNAFAYSYMVANGTPSSYEIHFVPLDGNITLTHYIDLADPKNALYIYDITGIEQLLTIGTDYEIISNNLVIDLQINVDRIAPGSKLYFSLYKNPLPAYIPSTPTKIGAYSVYLPRIELDTSYAIPTEVLVGHDGSRTILFGDYRDQLLLEFERRVYNLLLTRFRNQYYLPIRLESVKSGNFRTTRYSREEYLEITQSYLNKWAAKNKANYRVNNWSTSSETVPEASLWKLYNYRFADGTFGDKISVPGNWKGIFQYYYDTYRPNTEPWAMLGFSEQPSWWVSEYGDGILNTLGEIAWPNTTAYANMWEDLELGIIRQGPSAIFDPYTLNPQPQYMWARPGLSEIMPVDENGDIISVMVIFDVVYSGNPYAPFDGFDAEWMYGDGAPVEQAWMSTSGYVFSIQEFLYLMRPGPYGELLWDTAGTELSPGKIIIPGIDGPVISTINSQYVQNESYTSDDTFFSWMRPKNKDQIVHAETIDGVVQVRYGYQRWISDRILYLGKSVGTTFGQKIRTLDVNLANKFGGFTNKDTTNTYIEGLSPAATTPTLILPSNNFDVLLHKSPPVRRYAYSGVIVRALVDGTFAVYGYDLLKSAFTVLDRADDKIIDLTIGGTPAEFLIFNNGQSYNEGDIVRYNGVYYQSLVTQVAQRFIESNWKKLKSLPIIGGVSVEYRPVSKLTYTVVPYGSILNDIQSVFDLIIGWGAYLEAEGWKFDEVNQDTNQINNWLTSAKQFLFWLNSDWAPDASIQLSPLANKASLIVDRGYPDDIESVSNGLYSILDKYGVAIPAINTLTYREGPYISVEPSNLAVGGIYFLQVHSSETEHILIFDNLTSFNDVVYSPLLRERQQRIRFNGFRSNQWYGKMEAPGYLVIDNQLVPNFDTIVDSMRYFYDPNVALDNPSLEELGRHLIGYESKSYLDNLELSNDIQYLFYQGAIREKGTTKNIEKLFRSTKVVNTEVIEVYEEWALKLGDFGNTIEQVSTEFILKPEQNSGEVIVARLNYVTSPIGFVKQINILNAENVYVNVPRIVVDPPDATPTESWSAFSDLAVYDVGDVVQYRDLLNNIIYYSSKVMQGPGPFILNNWDAILTTRTAKAYAILNSEDRISRIDITDAGYGYLTNPLVRIESNESSSNLDRLYSVWQGEVIKDEILDNIINIDIDQPNIWTVRPPDPIYSLKLPVTDNIQYSIPNAGYVNFNDVDWYAYNVDQILEKWGTKFLNPARNETIWVADTFSEDWCVYKLFELRNTSTISWKISRDQEGNLLLLTPYSDTDPAENITITTQNWQGFSENRTDLGNMLVIQQVTNNVVSLDNTYTVFFVPYIGTDYSSPGTIVDPDDLREYNAYQLTDILGNTITEDSIISYELLNTLLLYKSMRWQVTPAEPTLPIYVGIGDLIWVDNVKGRWAVFKIQGDPGIWDIGLWNPDIIEFWSPNYGWDVDGPLYFNPYRVQEPLINTSLFESATIFSSTNNKTNQLVRLPIYDPFKGILPGPAKQNLTYILLRDPARYNVSGNITLSSSNVIFGEQQVGQLWWDLSSTRYVYYEQPIALDGSETELENLAYRRDNWARIFPGSIIKIYEWVKSDVPPNAYTGTGIPRDMTTYVEISSVNRLTNNITTNYYFWVLHTTDKPNIENRTMAAVDVANLLQSPRSQQFSFFSPIQQSDTNNSYMFYNVIEVLAFQGNNVQIQYRLSERDDQEHAQWSLLREGDRSSLITNQFWNKMVDSLCGYTKLLPTTEGYSNSILIAKYLPWDIYGWDISAWDSATSTTKPIYGYVLPVPDPSLGEEEKYGIEYRPRQGMFINLTAARKIFVEASNRLLQYIAIRDDNPSWNANVQTSIYWEYTNWYAVGFEGVKPTAVYTTLQEAVIALNTNKLAVGTIVQVIEGTIDGRYVLYNVTQPDKNLLIYSLEEVGVENAAIKLLDTIYTEKNVYGLSVELRELLNAFRTQIMINNYVVDQNELFFSMLNYVLSEQKNPNWVFKSSYIYIKDNNIPLTQPRLFVPDKLENIIDYIQDSKPYHTQIRDYTSVYVTTDIAEVTAFDAMASKITLALGPDNGGPYPWGLWDVNCNNGEPLAWESYSWDVCPPAINAIDGQTFAAASNIFGTNPLLTNSVDQFISQDDVYTIPLTYFDESKIGYSNLFPYTFSLDTINDPQTFITPYNIIGVQIGNETLIYGRDYYAEYNDDTTYTIYFYNNPITSIPNAIVWFSGGGMQNFKYNTTRTEIAYGFPKDDFVVNVDTLLPVNDVSMVLDAEWSPTTVIPLTGWGDIWDNFDASTNPVVSDAIIDAGGKLIVPWDVPQNIVYLDVALSYKENLSPETHLNFYRNSAEMAGKLVFTVNSPTLETDNIDIITVFVDPLTHPDTDILPNPILTVPPVPGVIWINGERIEYLNKTYVTDNTWELKLIRRGTAGTAPTTHLLNSLVFVERGQEVPGTFEVPNVEVWNASSLPAAPDVSTEFETDKYSSITSVPAGGLWYSITNEANFLKDKPGNSVPNMP